MLNLAQKMLLDMRVQSIRDRNINIPKIQQPKTRLLEMSYAAKLRSYQREINRNLMEVLEPLIVTYLQDATTEQIETVTEVASEKIGDYILDGAFLTYIVTDQSRKISEYNDRRWSAPLFAAVGFNAIRSAEMLNSWTVENIKLIKGVNDEQTKKIETLLLRSDREGMQPGGLTKEIRKIMKSTLSRATLIATDQTLKLNGQIDRMKQTESGVRKFRWRTWGDQQVRPEHQRRNGKIYTWRRGADGEFPGQPVRCRCWAEPDFSEILGEEFAPKERAFKPRKPIAKPYKSPKVKQVSTKPDFPIEAKKTPLPIEAKKTKKPLKTSVLKPEKRDAIVMGRARKRSRLTDKQQNFDQNARWINENPRKNRLLAKVGERSEWLHWEWVHGSNRKASVNMKAAAKKAFNLRGTVRNPRGLSLDLVDDLMISDVKKIHAKTVAQLKSKGIEKIKLYRGVNSLYVQPGAIESWTDDVSVAKKFGSIVMEQEFDVTRILDYYKSVNWSDGAWGNQGEYMVMR